MCIPYECHHNVDEHLNRLAFINCFIESNNTSCVYVIEDMNVDISDRNSLFDIDTIFDIDTSFVKIIISYFQVKYFCL